MYISELSLHGFKSFAKKEKLKFGKGVTVIVGPNGCGKTNIVDAIRWVLGEQKHSVLRSGKMEDVIFNGAEGQKPLSVCEAYLTVHNNKGKLPIEYNDIEIGRRVYRDGSSEYFMNRAPCRLKDIQDLFMDTGMGPDAYSVIELKMIEQILSETGDERKHMFEEAAGINKYKQQRRSALRNFDAVKQDLERISDIVLEVEQKVHGLALQLKRFQRHEKLTVELKEKEIDLAFIRIHDYTSQIFPMKQKVVEFQHLRESKTTDESIHEKELGQLKSVYSTQQGELEELQQGLQTLEEERETLRNDVLVRSEQDKAAKATIERLTREAENNRDKKTHLEAQIAEYEVEQKTLAPQAERQLQDYNSRKAAFNKVDQAYKNARKVLDDAQSARWEAQQKLSDDRSMLERTRALCGEKSEIMVKLTGKIAELDKAQKEQSREQVALEKERSKIKKTVDKQNKDITKARETLKELSEKRHNLSMEYHETRAQTESLKSQLRFYVELVEQKEGYPEGTRTVLENPQDFPRVMGTVGELLQVEDKFEIAFQTALGDLAKCLVVTDRKQALELLGQVQEKGAGEVSILPLKEAAAAALSVGDIPKGPGILGRGADLAKVNKKLQALAEVLVGRLLVVEDLSAAIQNTSLNGWDLVDLAGAYAGSGFLIKNRGKNSEGSILGREKKVAALSKQIQRQEAESVSHETELENLGDMLETRDQDIQDLTAALESSTRELNTVETELIRNHYGQSQALESIKTLQQDLAEAKATVQDLTAAGARLEPGLNRGAEKISRLKAKANAADKALLKVQNERDLFQQQVQDLRIELLNLENKRDNLNFQKRMASDTISELEERKREIVQETSSLQGRRQELQSLVKEGEKTLSVVSGKIRKKRSILDLKRQATQDTYQSIEDLQAKIRTEQHSRESILEELKHYELEIAQTEQRIALIRERIADRYAAEVPLNLVVDEEADDLELRIDRLQRSIDNIGPINMAVQQEYEEDSQRLRTLNEQQDDLVGSEENLRETIQKIDRVARKQFVDTFDRIKLNFEKLFILFFEGGKASLTLTGDPDPLDADITIYAQPPGKTNRNLRMLSAGEKSLTAIALLFAIYQYKPSPYCILDEVDAPLDDVNIRKFTRVLKSFASETQFIVVTHNKLTMEAADYMYGVTMERKGISKLVSVKFNGQSVETG